MARWDMVRFLAVFLCFLTLFPLSAAAQQGVSVRNGVHEDYARLVFDWSADTKYTLQKISDTEIDISFAQNASVTGAPPIDGNIKNFKVLSTTPLKVAITIPAGSRTRDFTIGSRVIIDVYNPGGTKTAETKKAEPEKKEISAKPAPKEEPVKQADLTTPVTPVAPATQPVGSLLNKKISEPALAAPSAPVAPANKLAPHVITLTSTRAIGMAVFEENGELWLTTDHKEYDIHPQLNGPNPELFAGFRQREIDDGKLYATKVPPGGLIAPQGGGLLWRIVVSSMANKKKPVEPVRKIADDAQDGRGGTLVWPFKEAHRILDVKDPVTGEPLKIITSENTADFAGQGSDYIEFETLTTHVGLVIRPKVDDLQVTVGADGVTVTRPGGLSIMPQDQLALARQTSLSEQKTTTEKASSAENSIEKPKMSGSGQRIFSFAEWQMGGEDALQQNDMALLTGLHGKQDGQKYEDLITLAKMYISNGRGAEALGYLNYALNDLPGLDSNPDFLALRGVAYALNGDAESAFRDLSIEDLKPFPEIAYWRAYALAGLGDWQQAYEILPAAFDALYDYPERLRYRISLVLAEVELRAGKLPEAKNLLDTAALFEKNMSLPYLSELNYLRGEFARQQGDKKAAEDIWKPLTIGKDNLYRAKAGLALTRLQYESKEIDTKKAIDNLERLRYAWRGDELEAAINYWLGRIYFDSGEYVKGLTIMRDAATYAPGTNLAQRISLEMNKSFQDLFLGENLKKVSPLDAVTLYEQFSELMPAGDAGDKIVQKLAEHLVNADLLGRAGDLLQKLIDSNHLKPDDAAHVAVRVAAIRLLDGQPQKSFPALDKAEALLKTMPADVATPARYREIALLRARSFSQNKQPNQALTLLASMSAGSDINRLRADIAWQAAYWQDAADALKDVIADENISLTRPMTEEQASLILNRAIALNLIGDRIALADMRETYNDAMAQTSQARPFEVVTRPRQNAALSDRQTLLDMVSEVDLFSNFLNAYKASQAPSN